MPPAIGLQLWTLRKACAEDFPGALAKIEQAGYTHIEPFAFLGLSAERLAAILKPLGLGVVSSHVGYDRLMGELERVMDEHDALGCKEIICPWLEESSRQKPEDFDRVGEALDAIGARLRGRGFALAYHNHDFEFTVAKNPDGLQRILARSAPENLGAQLDTYWVSFAGHDPVEYLRALGPRLRSIHLKDGDPKAGTFSPVGSGKIDMRAVVAAGKALGARAFVVEQDEHEGDPFDSIKQSLDFLKGL